MVLVLAVFVVAASSAAAVPTPTIPLHNDTATAGTDCPADGYAYWHFVLAPNDASAAFVTIVLSLDGDLVTFEGEAIVPNNGQTDNVFVGVPAGYTLTSLEAEGSYAVYSGNLPNQFNLSHVCAGTVPTTTPPTTTPPTTQPPPTTVPETTTTGPPEVLGTTTISVPPAEVEGVAVEAEELPYTGSDNHGLAAIGLAVAVAGFALATIARRRQEV
jgi:LPXTG-motif cell wall-anchored protein